MKNIKFTKKKGDSFGESTFFTQSQRSFNARTKTVTILGYISLDSFLEVIKKFPDDYVIFLHSY